MMGRGTRFFGALGWVLAAAAAAMLVLGFVWMDRALILGGVMLLVGGAMVVAQFYCARAAGLKLCRRMEGERREFREQLEQARRDQKTGVEAYRSELAHGLRMPVSVIQGYAELLASGMVTDEAARNDHLEKIIQRCQGIADLLSRQADSNEAPKLNLGQVDLLALARRTVEDMRAIAAEREIQLHVISSEPTLEVTADRSLVDRTLYSILENSVKYMGRPGNVTIVLSRQEDKAVIAVQDDGMGMEEREVPRVFEKHFQGSNRKNGQGQGLYLTRQSVVAHGGTITAQSRPGQGMGIQITLPIEPAGEPAAV